MMAPVTSQGGFSSVLLRRTPRSSTEGFDSVALANWSLVVRVLLAVLLAMLPSLLFYRSLQPFSASKVAYVQMTALMLLAVAGGGFVVAHGSGCERAFPGSSQSLCRWP